MAKYELCTRLELDKFGKPIVEKWIVLVVGRYGKLQLKTFANIVDIVDTKKEAIGLAAAVRKDEVFYSTNKSTPSKRLQVLVRPIYKKGEL